jgi:acetolactate synthase-1/2/3 large subunit
LFADDRIAQQHLEQAVSGVFRRAKEDKAMRGSHAIAQVLKQEAVEYVTCFPHNEIIDACAGQGIRPIMARTERVAINIADGYSRLNNGRRIGVCLVQDGPGIENGFGAVAQAYADSSPVFLLPGAYPRASQGVPPNFRVLPSFGPITKWADQINLTERIPQMMQRAFTLLRNGAPGPVVLEVPRDVLAGELTDDPFKYIPPRRSAPLGDPALVNEVVEALLKAQSPMIVAGQGIHSAQAWEALRQLAELIQVPVMTTMNGKSAFPEDHVLALGAGGNSRPRPVTHFLEKADFVLGIGTSFTRSNFVTPVPPGKVMGQITIDERDLSKDYSISTGVIGDARAVLRQMIERVQAQTGPKGRQGENRVSGEVRAVRERFMQAWMPRLTSDEVPINPYRVVWELMHAVDRHSTVVTHDAGNPRDQMLPFYETIAPRTYVGWGKSTQLGTGLGLAMGAKLARPDWLAVNVMGDAAFGMVGMDFETAVRNHIPVLTVVLNNGRLGGYDHLLPVSSERYRLRFMPGNRYNQVAEALGGYSERVEQPEAIQPALQRCIQEVGSGRAALLEVMTREDPTLPKE